MPKKINIGKNYKPFIIAEISGNHNGSLKNALSIVRSAARCGVSAIKLQTYTADTMTLNTNKKEFLIKDKKSLWNGYSLYDLYKKASTPWNWHQSIFNEAKKNKLIYFSTPFDESAVDFLEKFNVPIYKVSSFENTDLRLIKIIAQKKKPMIISLGMASLKEISEAVEIAKLNGCKKIILMKCTSDYPAKFKDINLLTINYLKKQFKCEVGFSDHTLGVSASVAAVACGATVIEKHFMGKKNINTVDSAFSLNEYEMGNLVKETNKVWEALGIVKTGYSNNEKKNLKFRRSIYVAQDIKKGENFNRNNIKCIRPGYGLSTKYYEEILKRRSSRNINAFTPLTWKLINKN